MARKGEAPDTIQTSHGKRKRGNEDQSTVLEKHKRRKIGNDREKVMQPQSLVIWRKRSKRNGNEVPLVQAGDGKQVALLENWRDLILKDDELSRQPRIDNVEVGNRGKDDARGAKSKNSHKIPGVSRQTDRRRSGKSGSDRRRGTSIQQTDLPPVTLESGANVDEME